MKIAYLDCASGISGDMVLGALIDSGMELAEVQSGVDSLGLPSCQLAVTETRKAGFRALQLTVHHQPEHTHRHLHHILAMIERSRLTPTQQELAGKIFHRLAEAEARVHGTTVEKVHFHEVGAVDSIADIVGSAIAWDLLGVDRVVCSPVPTGTGFVQIAHGRCAIPAPATAELLRGVPLADNSVEGELTTPTGAAILTCLADAFGPLPAMKVQSVGYGAGQRDYAHPNLLRLLVGESDESDQISGEQIALLETNLDDSTGEVIGHCVEQLWKAGALDVSLVALQMKKGRPGVQLQVQCPLERAQELAAVLFCETSTLGLRSSIVNRIVLPRQSTSVPTSWGEIAGVVAQLPDGTQRFSPEYKSCREIADKHRVPLAQIMETASRAFLERSSH